MNLAQTTYRLREQMRRFLGNLSTCKPAWRFCLESLYGIVTRQSLHLSEIARALNEDIALRKTVGRLSRQAGREGLHEAIEGHVIQSAAHRIGEDTLLVLDPSDLNKPHARAMEYLAQVRDGSEGKLAKGYWLCQVVGVPCGGSEITPLVNRLWSQDAPGFESENQEILGCVEAVNRHVKGRGVWVIDRGGDRAKLFYPLLERGLEFIVRLRGDRHLLHRARARAASELGARCRLPYREVVIRHQSAGGRERRVVLDYGACKVRLPNSERALWLVVIRGFGQEPILLLTTRPLTPSRASQWWVVQAYLTRWRIEDTLRFAKQSFQLEDVRVRSYQSLRNLMALALLAMYFVMAWMGRPTRLDILTHHALEASRRLFGIPDFLYYALADGLKEIFQKTKTPPFQPNQRRPPPNTQHDLLKQMGC